MIVQTASLIVEMQVTLYVDLANGKDFCFYYHQHYVLHFYFRYIFFVVRSIRHLGAEPVSCMDTGVTPPHRVCPYMLIKELATPQPDILDVQVDNLEDVRVARNRN